MKQRIATLFAGGVLLVALTGAAIAGPLDDAIAALQRGDYTMAMRLIRPLAEQGNAGAQTDLGVIYDSGLGVPQDYAQAVVWYHKAADQGDAGAQFNLGFMYAQGHGVAQDYAQAHMWFSLAASRAPDAAVRRQAVKARDAVAAKMTPDQIAEAQRLASEWKPTR
jgi:TPR repeat protein